MAKDPLQKNSLHFSVIPYLMSSEPETGDLLDIEPAKKSTKQPTKISEEIKYEV